MESMDVMLNSEVSETPEMSIIDRIGTFLKSNNPGYFITLGNLMKNLKYTYFIYIDCILVI